MCLKFKWGIILLFNVNIDKQGKCLTKNTFDKLNINMFLLHYI